MHTLICGPHDRVRTFSYWLKSAAAPRAVSGAARRVGCRGAPRSWRFAPSAQPTAPDTAHQTGWTFRRTVRLAAYFVAARFATSVSRRHERSPSNVACKLAPNYAGQSPDHGVPPYSMGTELVPDEYPSVHYSMVPVKYLEVPFWYLGLVEPSTERKALGQVIRALRELDGLSRDQLPIRPSLGSTWSRRSSRAGRLGPQCAEPARSCPWPRRHRLVKSRTPLGGSQGVAASLGWPTAFGCDWLQLGLPSRHPCQECHSGGCGGSNGGCRSRAFVLRGQEVAR